MRISLIEIIGTRTWKAINKYSFPSPFHHDVLSLFTFDFEMQHKTRLANILTFIIIVFRVR